MADESVILEKIESLTKLFDERTGAIGRDIAEIKNCHITQNKRVRKNRDDIIRLQTWVSLVGGSELLAVVAFTGLKLCGII